MKNEIEDIIALFFRTKGKDISIYEDDFLRKTLDKRLVVTGVDSYHRYQNYLEANPFEMDLFLDSLHIAFSEFFRNPLTFSVLEQVVLPSVIEKKKIRNQKDIRVWSAACASGQEPYSFAMIFDEMIDLSKSNMVCRIFATDISESELLNARKGLYQTQTVHKVSLKRIQKYFKQQGDYFTINPKLRDYIDFSFFDLLSEHGDSPPASIYGDFDLIFCSNMLFYYKQEIRMRILEKLTNNLAPGGFLVTGETEREIVKNHNFREIFTNSAVYQKSDFKYQS